MSKTWTALVEVKGNSGSYYPVQIKVADHPDGYVAIKRLLEAQYGSGRVINVWPDM